MLGSVVLGLPVELVYSDVDVDGGGDGPGWSLVVSSGFTLSLSVVVWTVAVLFLVDHFNLLGCLVSCCVCRTQCISFAAFDVINLPSGLLAFHLNFVDENYTLCFLDM